MPSIVPDNKGNKEKEVSPPFDGGGTRPPFDRSMTPDLDDLGGESDAPLQDPFNVQDALAGRPFTPKNDVYDPRRVPGVAEAVLRDFAGDLLTEVTVIRKLLSLADGNPQQAGHALAQAASHACGAMERILHPPILGGGLDQLMRLRIAMPEWQTAHMKLDEFLSTELQLLEKCGAPHETVECIEQDIHRALVALLHERPRGSRTIYQALAVVKKQVCDLAQTLAAEELQAWKREETKAVLTRTFRVILGCAVVVTNATGPALQVPMVALVSEAVGLKLIEAGVS